MLPDEKAIIDYLKGWPSSFVSGKEIARKSVERKRYEQDRGWAIPVLMQLVRLGIVESDHLGYFRLKLEEKKKKRDRHISPQMMNILQKSGKEFEGMEVEEADKFVSPIKPYPKDEVPAHLAMPVKAPAPAPASPATITAVAPVESGIAPAKADEKRGENAAEKPAEVLPEIAAVAVIETR